MSKYKSGYMEFEEASYLSDLFQQIVTDCRIQLPLFEELISRSSRLQSQLSSLVSVFSGFLETAEKICYHAVDSKSDPELGACLERIVTRHRNMELIMKTLTSIISDCLSTPIQSKLETWRKRISILDKEHSKSFKKIKAVVKKKSQAVEKLSKKVKKKAGDAELCEEHEMKLRDLSLTGDMWVDRERAAVRDIQNIERSLLSTAATGWKQIINQEFAMFNQIQTLAEVVDKIDNKEEGFADRSKFELERSFSVSVHTPAGSPYTGKSRSESCKSRNSFSSRHSSLDSHLDDRTSSMTTSHYFSQNQSFVSEAADLRPSRQSVMMTDNESLWLSYSEAHEEILTVPVPVSDTVSAEKMTPLSPPPHSGDWYKPCLPQRGSYPVSSEPHYSVPKNNTKVGSQVTNNLHHHPGHPSSSSSVNGVTYNSNVVVVEDICHNDRNGQNNHDGQNGHTNKIQPEVDKTPTNEAGKMQDALEKLDISSESCSSGYDSNDVHPLHIEDKERNLEIF